MANMSLGAYTFESNPAEPLDVIKKYRSCSHVGTYSDVGFFSWGPAIKGKTITLKWSYMSLAQFDSLKTLYEADATVVFNPQDGSGKTYNVEILSFDGEYHIDMTGPIAEYRKNISMALLIMSEI